MPDMDPSRQSKVPSFWDAFFADYLAVFGAGALVYWVVLGACYFAGAETEDWPVYVFTGTMMLVFVPIGANRIRRIVVLRQRGVVVPARVVNAGAFERTFGWKAVFGVAFARATRIDIEYEFNGQTYRKARTATKSVLRNAVREGEINVLVDPLRPSRFMVAERY